MKKNIRGFIDPITLGFLFALVGTGFGVATIPEKSANTVLVESTYEVVQDKNVN